MGLFGFFKKNKEDVINEGDGNFLENYFKSKFKLNTDGINYSSNDIARIEKNCEILDKMEIPIPVYPLFPHWNQPARVSILCN